MPPAAAPPRPAIATPSIGRKSGSTRSTLVTSSGGAWNVRLIRIGSLQFGMKVPPSIFCPSGVAWKMPSESFSSGYLRLFTGSKRYTFA